MNIKTNTDTLCLNTCLEQVDTQTLFTSDKGANAPTSSSSFSLASSNQQSKRFCLIKPLGHGGQGSVFLARDDQLHREVAIKVLGTSTPELNRTVLAQARVQAQIDHPNICKIYQVEQADDNNTNSYLVMQLIPGVNALSFVEQNPHLQPRQLIEIMQKICDGLQALHEAGIVHRDIKPANIMILKTDDDELQPFIVDFGLADSSNIDAESKTVLRGTPAFMPPEQWQGMALDSKSDIYSFGITLYQLLTGKLPPDLSSQTSRQPLFDEISSKNLPIEINAIIKKCIQPDREWRYDSAKALNNDFKRFLAAEPVHCIPGKSYWLKKKLLKHRWQVSLIALAALGTAATVTWQYVQDRQQQIRETLLTDFTAKVEQMEADVRLTRLSPRHDTTAKTHQWLQQINQLSKQIKAIGDDAYGPGHYAIGRMYYVLQQYDEALKHLQLSWNFGFKQPRVAYNLALTHSELFEQKKDLAENIRSKSRRAATLQKLDDLHRAPVISLLQQGLTGTDFQSYPQALLYYYQDDFDQAEAVLNQTNDLPNWFYAHHWLRGNIALARSQKAVDVNDHETSRQHTETALSAFNQAASIARSDLQLTLRPLAVYMKRLNNSLYGKKGDFLSIYSQAMAQLKKATEISPDHHLILFEQGRFLAKKSDYEAQNSGNALNTRDLAIGKFEQALKQAPENIDILLNLAWGYAKKLRQVMAKNQPVDDLPQRAVNTFERIPDSHRDYLFYNYYAFVRHQLAKHSADTAYKSSDDNVKVDTDFSAAVDAYNKAVLLKPKSIAAYINLGAVYTDWSKRLSPALAKQNINLAIAQYNQVATLNPQHFVLNFNLAQAYSTLSRLNAYLLQSMDEAINKGFEHIEIAAKAHPEHPFVVLEKANLEVSKAMNAWHQNLDHTAFFETATTALNASLQKHPNNTVLLDGRAWIVALEQQLAYFSAMNKIANRTIYSQALGFTNQVLSKRKTPYFTLLLLNQQSPLIGEQDWQKLPADNDNRLIQAEWLSQTGQFEAAERLSNQVDRVFPAIVWQYRLQHLIRWLSASTGNEQQFNDTINLCQKADKVTAALNQHFPAMVINLKRLDERCP